MILRDYQTTAVDDLVSTLSREGGTLLQAQCGTGKTIMSLAAVSRLDINRVVILVDQIDIAAQWYDNITKLFPTSRTRVMGNGHSVDKIDDAEFKIVIAQSLFNKDWISDPLRCHLLIVDEAHVFSAPSFNKAIFKINYVYSLALTATPERKDGLEILFKLHCGLSTVIVEADAFKSRVLFLKLSGFNKRDSEIIRHEDYTKFFCKKKKTFSWVDACRKCELFDRYNPNACGGLVQKYVKSWKNVIGDRLNFLALIKAYCYTDAYLDLVQVVLEECLSAGRSVIALGSYIDQLEKIQALVPASTIFVSKKRKQHLPNREHAMQNQITLCTYGIAAKALDVPNKDCLILLTPTSDVRQAVGRIERFYLDKKRPVVIDILGELIPFKALGNRRKTIYDATNRETASLTVNENFRTNLRSRLQENLK